MGRPSSRPEFNKLDWVGETDATNSFRIGKSTDLECDILVPVKMPSEPTIGGISGELQAVTLAAAATVIAVTGKVMAITGDGGANTIATISGGIDGMTLTLIFEDALVTITDTGTSAADTVNLSAAFTSTSSDVLSLVYDGISWREASRSIN